MSQKTLPTPTPCSWVLSLHWENPFCLAQIHTPGTLAGSWSFHNSAFSHSNMRYHLWCCDLYTPGSPPPFHTQLLHEKVCHYNSELTGNEWVSVCFLEKNGKVSKIIVTKKVNYFLWVKWMWDIWCGPRNIGETRKVWTQTRLLIWGDYKLNFAQMLFVFFAVAALQLNSQVF